MFAEGQAYVALSRVRSMEGLQILGCSAGCVKVYLPQPPLTKPCTSAHSKLHHAIRELRFACSGVRALLCGLPDLMAWLEPWVCQRISCAIHATRKLMRTSADWCRLAEWCRTSIGLWILESCTLTISGCAGSRCTASWPRRHTAYLHTALAISADHSADAA